MYRLHQLPNPIEWIDIHMSESHISTAGFNAIRGYLYVDDELVLEGDLNTNERYNPWDNPLESTLGAVELAAGTYTLKFEIVGGQYIMDKMIVTPNEAGDSSVSDGDVGIAIAATEATTIEAESYTGSNDIEAYDRDAGQAIKYIGGSNCHTSWKITVESKGTYSFTTIGTGMQGVIGTPITGNLYVNDEFMLTASLTTNEKYNPFDNPLESLLGSLELEAGTYTVKFEIVGGQYFMDKMIVAPSVAE